MNDERREGSAVATDSAREYLTFTLGEEEYGIDILKVQEIRGYDAVTKIANSPDFIKGVINMRGIIVPIIDMRLKFHLGQVEYNEFTVVIILNISGRVSWAWSSTASRTSSPCAAIRSGPRPNSARCWIRPISTVWPRSTSA
jgi:chemotaxis signal transduction protein